MLKPYVCKAVVERVLFMERQAKAAENLYEGIKERILI
jgi:hypothetical protein